MAQHHFALAAQGVFQGLRAHIGVAVAVAANPLAHAQKAVRNGLAQGLLDISVDFGDLAQKGRFVIAQRVFHLVGHGQLAVAQQAGLPQLHDPGADLRLIGGEFTWRQRVFAAGAGCAMQADVVAGIEQFGDVALSVQNAFALHLGGMGREHRRDKAVRQCFGNGFASNACGAQMRHGLLQTALLRQTGALFVRLAANLVAVFGQIGQMAEVGEGADHADGLIGTQTFEQLFQGPVGLVVGVAAEGHRQRTNPLHQFEGRNTVLLADHIAQNPAEQADVFDQGTFIVFAACRRSTEGGRGSHPLMLAFREAPNPLLITNRLRLCDTSPSPPARAVWHSGKPNICKPAWVPWDMPANCWA